MQRAFRFRPSRALGAQIFFDPLFGERGSRDLFEAVEVQPCEIEVERWLLFLGDEAEGRGDIHEVLVGAGLIEAALGDAIPPACAEVQEVVGGDFGVFEVADDADPVSERFDPRGFPAEDLVLGFAGRPVGGEDPVGIEDCGEAAS